MRPLLTFIVAFSLGTVAATLVFNPEPRQRLGIGRADAAGDLYAPRNWDRGSPSSLNISVFAFSDRNRNGEYDLGDKPMNRVAFRLTRPNGSSRIERSNINGYTNFGMHLGANDADIVDVGKRYEFDVIAPPQWSVTTGNEEQSTQFRAIEGSIAGMGAVTPPGVVGLAPAPTLHGRWPAHAGQFLIARGEAGRQTRIGLDEQGSFSTRLSPGNWRIETEDGVIQRQIDMGFAPIMLAAPLPPAAVKRDRRARPRVTVDFDDLDRSFIEKLPAGYAGLAWDYLLAVDNQFYKGPGYVNGLMSGANVAYNSSGHPVTVGALPPQTHFDFLGGHFSIAWHNAEGEELILRAWRGDEQVGEERLTLSHLHPTYLQADYLDVTKVTIETAHYWQFVADDLHVALQPRTE